MTRRLVVASVVVVAVLGPAAPAGAHTVTGVQPTNYRSEITAITPDTPELTVDLVDLGNRIRLSYHGTEDLVVVGYDGEPYLRLGPRGVFENRRSPAVALNRPNASSTTMVPPAAVEPSAPEWHRVSDGSAATWRDRRLAGKESNPPPWQRGPDRPR